MCVCVCVFADESTIRVSVDRTPVILERLLLMDLMPLLDWRHVADTLPQVHVCPSISAHRRVCVCVCVCESPLYPPCVRRHRFPQQKSPLSWLN